jgi:hypothetical protein
VHTDMTPHERLGGEQRDQMENEGAGLRAPIGDVNLGRRGGCKDKVHVQGHAMCQCPAPSP